MSTNTTTADQKELFGHPMGLYILFFTEMWERFSYYGMRALLTLYMIASAEDHGLGWSKGDALALYGWYTMSVYVASIPGGIIADRLLGQKKCVMLGGLFLCAGHGVMAFPGVTAFYSALTLIVIGVGFLKPNISTMVGGLYEPGDARRDQGFSIFYMGINVGALLSALIVGTVGEKIGWHYGFGLAGIGMVLGQIQFMYGQKYLRHVGNLVKSTGETASAAMKSPLSKVERDRVFVLFVSFLIVIVFWGAFEQAGGLMSIYTLEKVDRGIGGIEIPATVFQSLNPLYIILFATAVAGYWHKRLKQGKQASAIFKMATGTIIMGLGFVFMVLAAREGAPQEAIGKRAEAAVIAAGIPSEDTTFWELAQAAKAEVLNPAIGSDLDAESQRLAASEVVTKNLPAGMDQQELLRLIRLELTNVALLEEKPSHRKTRSITEEPENLDDEIKPITICSGEEAVSFWERTKDPVAQVRDDVDSAVAALVETETARILASLPADSDATDLRAAIEGGLTSVAGSTTKQSAKNEEKRDAARAGVANASYLTAVRASTAMFWLLLAYLFHTIGELCSSPVSLSFITKLAPVKYASLMMGVYFAVTGLGSKVAGLVGEQVENFDEFTIFSGITVVTIVFSAILLVFLKPLNRLTHGAEDLVEDADE